MQQDPKIIREVIEFLESCASYNGDGSVSAATYRDIVADIGRQARYLLDAINYKGGA